MFYHLNLSLYKADYVKNVKNKNNVSLIQAQLLSKPAMSTRHSLAESES
jgi:hypothetical protein